MKINALEAHDRLLQYNNQSDYISKGADDCKYKNPLSSALLSFSDYIYIFAHKREIGIDEKLSLFNEDLKESLINPMYTRKFITLSDVPSARILWQPRLSKPEPQTNSMLFKAYKNSEGYEVFWIIPPPELWNQYKKGNMSQDPVIVESIHKFKTDKERLSSPEKDDLPDESVKAIYKQIAAQFNKPDWSMV